MKSPVWTSLGFQYAQHVKTGHLYKVIGTSLNSDDLTEWVVYHRPETPDHLWHRPLYEFMDRRFRLMDYPLSGKERELQAKFCPCQGVDDMCVCQNQPTFETILRRIK